MFIAIYIFFLVKYLFMFFARLLIVFFFLLLSVESFIWSRY